MDTVNIREYIDNELVTGDYGEAFADFTEGYIGDFIQEIAESHVSIYDHELLEWAPGNTEYIERAVREEFVCHREFDFYGAIRAGQYIEVEENIHEHYDDCIMLAVLSNLPTDELTFDQVLQLGIVSTEFHKYDEIQDIIRIAEQAIGFIRLPLGS